MSQVQEQVPVVEPRRLVTWKLALLTFSLAGLVGLTLAVQQFLVKFLYDQSAHTRTIWGLLFMVLGVLGPVLPLLLVIKRRAFARLGRGKQWAAVVAIPALYGAAFALCFVASTYTQTLIMDRPSLTLLVRFDRAKANEPISVVMHGLMREMPSGRGYRDADGGARRYHFQGYEGYLRFPQEVTIRAEGTSRAREDGSVEIALDFDVKETFRLQVEGLAEAQITRDGEAVPDRAKFGPGKYKVVITGRPK
jgi:lipid-A-disaccharide synthase-like uncharacterized protein